MITVEKLEKGTYFDDAFKISFRYDPTTVAKVKELAERRYLPEDRAWEIPAHELPALIEKVGLSNIKSEEAVVQALNTKEIEDKREATQERLKGIKPVRDFDFKTAPLPHQIEAFNYGMEKNSLLIGDEQGLGKTKESIDICVARKKELIKTLIVCGVNSVKYNWEKEIQIHSNEGCVMVDGKTMDVRVQQLNDWYRGSSYFGVINIETYTVTLTDEDGTVTTIKVGNATGNDYYATVDDTEKVYTIPATSLDDIQTELDQIAQLDTYPSIGSGNLKKEVITQNGETTTYDSENENQAEDVAAVAGGLGAVKLSEAADYSVDDADLAGYGLDATSRITVEVTYTSDDEDQTMTLYIGGENGSGDRYVMINDSRIVYLISDEICKNILNQ